MKIKEGIVKKPLFQYFEPSIGPFDQNFALKWLKPSVIKFPGIYSHGNISNLGIFGNKLNFIKILPLVHFTVFSTKDCSLLVKNEKNKTSSDIKRQFQQFSQFRHFNIFLNFYFLFQFFHFSILSNLGSIS